MDDTTKALWSKYIFDEFTTRRYEDLATGFVDIYAEGNATLAAKLLVEASIPDKDLPHLRELINKEFLHRGWTFPEQLEEVCDEGC